MGKIIATWHVTLTQREPDGIEVKDGESATITEPIEAPTIDALTEQLGEALVEEFGGDWNASAERTDR